MNRKLPPESYEYYVSLGLDRSYAKVAEHYGVSKVAVTNRATQEGWQDRVRELEAQARAKSEKRAVEDMAAVREGHLKTARFLQVRAIEALRSMPLAKAADAVRALDLGWKHEMLLLGEPTERHSNIEEIVRHEYREWLTDEDAGGELGETP